VGKHYLRYPHLTSRKRDRKANNTGYLTPDNTADETYAVANDGATSRQLTNIKITNGLIVMP